MSAEKNEYFEFLKENSGSPQEAYRRYAMEKFIWRNFAVSPQASEEVKGAFQLQSQINDYCKELVNDSMMSFMQFSNISAKDAVNYINENQKVFDFLSIERQELISLLTGDYAVKLNNASKEIRAWETLEQLMNAEKNTALPLMDNTQLEKGFNSLIEDYALESIVVSKAKSTQKLINQVGENCESLSKVVDCKPEQIGINRYNFALDTEDDPNAGYLGTHFSVHKKLYLNSYLMHDAFAHEWLHGMDAVWAQTINSPNFFMSEQLEGSVKELLDAGMEADKDAISQVKSQINEKITQYIDEIVERYNRGGHINNASEVKQKCHELCEQIQAGNENNDENNFHWDKHEFAQILNSYTNPSCPKSFAPYMITEIEMMQHVNFSQNFNESLFYQYAKKMDDNLVNVAKMPGFDDYSKSTEERFARMFESYVELVLQEKGIENSIVYTKGNSYTPRQEEVKIYRDKWDNLMQDFRDVLEQIYPVQEKVKENSQTSNNENEQNHSEESELKPAMVKKGIENNIGNLREQFLNKSKNAVKYK